MELLEGTIDLFYFFSCYISGLFCDDWAGDRYHHYTIESHSNIMIHTLQQPLPRAMVLEPFAPSRAWTDWSMTNRKAEQVRRPRLISEQMMTPSRPDEVARLPIMTRRVNSPSELVISF